MTTVASRAGIGSGARRPGAELRRRRRFARTLALCATSLTLTASVRVAAGPTATTNVVVYVEATDADPRAVRDWIRGAIPEAVVVLDSDDYRAALLATDQEKPLARSLASDNAGALDRARRAAANIHADAVVVAIATERPRERNLRLVLVLPSDGGTPPLDKTIVLDTPAEGTESMKVRAVLRPALEALVASNAPRPSETPSAAPPPSAAPAPPAPPPNALPTFSLSMRTWPGGGAPNIVSGRVAIPITNTIAVLPSAGGGYLASPPDDMAYLFGGGLRFTPSATWNIEATGYYARFPKLVIWWQGAVYVGATFGLSPGRPPLVKLAVAVAGTRWLWKPPLGAPGAEVFDVLTQVDAQVHPLPKLLVAPGAALFIFDKSLSDSRRGIGGVSFSSAPYPVFANVGGSVGFDSGNWLFYGAVRRFFFAANAGEGTSVGPGVRLSLGPAFADFRVLGFWSDSKGPLSNPALDFVPMAALDIGGPLWF